MRHDGRKGWAAGLVLWAALAGGAWAQQDEGGGAAAEARPEKTLSPYFLVKSGMDKLENFPLEATAVKVQIEGVIADVTVKQTYRNAGDAPIEAIYVFPGSTRAAVHGLKMTIGDRVVEAKIQERSQARKTYEAAKSEGKSASLLEQQRPNVFQMNVANILPGDTIDVELRYAELLVPDEGEYALVYPTVVGPRYSNRPEATAAEEHRFVSNPYLRKGVASPTRFSIDVALAGAMPLADVGSPSHKVAVHFVDQTRAEVTLDAVETEPANRDFILHYRLEGGKIQTGLLLDGAGDEKFFVLMVQPPERVAAAEVPPREYIFVIDVSGSMTGFPLDVCKKLMRGLLGGLRPQDSFDIVLFAGVGAYMSPTTLPATPDNIKAGIQFVEVAHGGGGTELLTGLATAMQIPHGDGARSIVLMTDGYVDVESESFDMVRANAAQASVYAFGIGSAVNRFLIEGIAHAGHGEPFIVTSPDHAEAAVGRFQSYVSTPLLTDVAVNWGSLEVYDVEPAKIPILTSQRPLVVCGKWRGQAKGSVSLRGKRGAEAWSATVPVGEVGKTSALRYLWARETLRTLSDYAGVHESDALREKIVGLGLKYTLLTRYTSFVAVDEVVRNTTGSSQTVKQPLPLPQNVSELAVGTGAPGTPEPATLALLGLAGGAAARYLRRRRS